MTVLMLYAADVQHTDSPPVDFDAAKPHVHGDNIVHNANPPSKGQ